MQSIKGNIRTSDVVRQHYRELSWLSKCWSLIITLSSISNKLKCRQTLDRNDIVVCYDIQCVQKKKTKMIFVISSIKLGRFW